MGERRRRRTDLDPYTAASLVPKRDAQSESEKKANERVPEEHIGDAGKDYDGDGNDEYGVDRDVRHSRSLCSE